MLGGDVRRDVVATLEDNGPSALKLDCHFRAFGRRGRVAGGDVAADELKLVAEIDELKDRGDLWCIECRVRLNTGLPENDARIEEELVPFSVRPNEDHIGWLNEAALMPVFVANERPASK